MNSPVSHIARLEAKVDDLQKLIEQQREEGKERGEKIEDMKKELASQNARVGEMERHVRTECVWGNGEISDIKVNMAKLSVSYDKLDKDVGSLTHSVDKMRIHIIWIIAGSVIGGGAASGASEFLLKLF